MRVSNPSGNKLVLARKKTNVVKKYAVKIKNIYSRKQLFAQNKSIKKLRKMSETNYYLL